MYGYVFRKKSPPPELSIGLDWQRFHTPYVAGGLRDQPLRLFGRMKIALNVYSACVAWKSKPSENDKNWYALNGGVVKLMEYVWSLEETDG